MSKKRFSEIFEQNRSNFGVLANFCPNNYGNAWRGSILPKNAKTGFRLGMDDEKELGGGNGQSGLNPALKSIIRKFSKKPGRTKLLDLATWMFNYYVSIVNLKIKIFLYVSHKIPSDRSQLLRMLLFWGIFSMLLRRSNFWWNFNSFWKYFKNVILKFLEISQIFKV